MKIVWAHRAAILLAVLTLVVVALGAYLTGEVRTMPGAKAAEAVSAPELKQAHQIAGDVLGLATVFFAIWFSSAPGWAAMVVVLAERFLGNVPVIHAMLAPAFMALISAVVVMTSEGWRAGPKPVKTEWAPLRPLGMAVPVLIFMQIGLGAAFRHNAMGVLSHIMNALVVLLVAMVAGIFVLRQYPEHPALRPAALTLLIVTGVQVLLGFAVYMVLLMSEENNSGLAITGVLHVVNGSLTLASGVILAMQMKRNLEV